MAQCNLWEKSWFLASHYSCKVFCLNLGSGTFISLKCIREGFFCPASGSLSTSFIASTVPSILHQVDFYLSFQSQPRCLCSVKLLDPPVFPSFHPYVPLEGFPGGSEVKNPSANAGDKCSIPGLGRSPGGGHGYPVQYSCLENPMDRGAWWATAHGVANLYFSIC